ncbi:LptF/LptG family permease [Puia dinghuensis]|uniref:Membrane protein n=1 Tax=Puia dinghuensis TaxID=1792502 RepID=A0A8J2UGU3_9BACT|nr:LptF/LptG family permease [Puia dinghuensis]GGB16002.1 membrane protein [Puia dinghuensis]
MIKLLDRYILKKFLGTFVFTMLVITSIAVVIDTSEKADDMVRSGLTVKQLIMNYYIGFVPFIMSMIYPLMVFIAVIYFTSKMAGRSEIIAILAGGVRYNRMLRPFLIGAAFLSLIFWLASQYWVPRANEIRTDFQAVYVDRNSSYNGDPYRNNNFYLRVDPVTFVGFRYYDTANKVATNFFLQKLKGNKVYYNVRAESVRWDPARKDWKLTTVIERTIDGLKETMKRDDTMHVNLNVQPKELRRDDYLKDKLTTPELQQFIHMEEVRGSEGLNTFKVELYHRDATPFSVIIMALIGAVIASRKIRGGSGVHLAVGIVLAAIFVVMDKFAVTFSTKGNLPPVLAAWLPNIIFSGVAGILYVKTPK